MIETTPDRTLRRVPRIHGERCGARILEVHPDQLKAQIKNDGAELANHCGRAITVFVRLLLLAAVWIQLKGAERIGLLEQRWAERRNA